MNPVYLIFFIPITLFFAAVFTLFGSELKKSAAALWLVIGSRIWGGLFLLAGAGLVAGWLV